MDLTGLVFKAASFLIPPHDANVTEQREWQMRISVSMLLAFTLLILGFATAFDALPGVPGFARSNDLASVISEIRQNRVNTVDNQILELRIKHCKASTDESKELYWAKIQALVTEYRGLTGVQNYPIPACNDL